MSPRGGTMLILYIVFLCIVIVKIATKEIGSDAVNRASSVEVFFVDAELVDDEFDGSRWEELSCGCDTEGGDLLSVCEHPSTEEFGTDACGACDLVFALCFHSREGV